MLSLESPKMWYRRVNLFGYTYYLPISTIQLLVFRNHSEKLFYGNLEEVRKVEQEENCRLDKI